jgi:hypothetical protein
MAEMHGHPHFYKLLERMAEVHSAKNHDYAGDENPLYNLHAVKRVDIEPSVGAFVRMLDKWTRLEMFVKNGVLYVKDENIVDTLIDLANYALLMIILLKEEKDEKENQND